MMKEPIRRDATPEERAEMERAGIYCDKVMESLDFLPTREERQKLFDSVAGDKEGDFTRHLKLCNSLADGNVLLDGLE